MVLQYTHLEMRMSNFTGFWKIASPKTRKQLYTTLSTDAYDPRSTDGTSMAAVTWYSQVMKGPGGRNGTYKQYDAMDADIDISRSLDIIAEEMSGKDNKTELPFIIQWQKEDTQDISDTTSVTVRAALRQWSQMQDLNKRIFSTARCMIKYGDCFFRKASDTRKWGYVDPSNVVGIEIDEIGTKVAYHIRKPGVGNANMFTYGGNKAEQTDIVPASAMIHFTMCDDMGDSAPFGSSVLRPIFRVYRQLSMLEDAVIIYRIVRAPERRVFYIDVGNQNQQQVKRYLESVKNEIRQKRATGTQTNGVKDSVDGQYDPQCLTLDTRIPLLDGRTLELNELITEYRAGKKNWVYSCDPVTGALAPGEIAWAGETRKSAQLLKITLDTGETITCTPDHQFPVQGVGFVRADELSSSMSLVPFNRQYSVGQVTSPTPFHQGYEEIFDVSTGEWIRTHHLVKQHVQLTEHTHETDEDKTVIHHADFNKHNNSPSNLLLMGQRDHFKLHTDHNKERFDSWSPEKQAEQVQALHKGLTEYHDLISDEKVLKEQSRAAAMHKANRKAGKQKVSRRESTYGPALGQRLEFSAGMKARLIDLVKANPSVRKMPLLELINSDELFMIEFKKVNKSTASGRRGAPSWTFLEVIKEELQAGTFAELKQKLVLGNHKIVKIEEIAPEDTGCITVGEEIHKHHTFALASGVFTKNSIQEDLFFPVTAAGRGSRVETLPGGAEDFGTNLLKQFQDKIFRGLRIPTSYMGGSGGGSDPQTNDGKVGIAYIEELRFANFISRLQDRINEVYDEEFKIYLKVCGLRVDDEVFQIKLPDPANFALYRQAALDADLIASFTNIQGVKILSQRFILKRYLGLSDDEIQMNEVLLKEERNLTDNATVPIMQQLYDDAVYANREAITVQADEPSDTPSLGNAGADSADAADAPDTPDAPDAAAGLLDSSFQDKPFSKPAATPDAPADTPAP
jgi:hypothetical protein